MGEPMLRVTPAPEAYDGFGTETVKVLEEKEKVMGRPYRLVRMLPEHAEWQTGRYRSGMYPVLTGEEFEEWKRLGLL